MNKIQVRTIPFGQCGLHLRSTSTGESRTVEGHAVVFGVRSLNLTRFSEKREVYEIMEPGCITPDLLKHSDIVLTAFHNDQIILGRWRCGTGTLNLSLDNRGLKTVCTLAETATADELLTSIKRGDISGMSFAYITDEDDSNHVSYELLQRSRNGKEIWLRHVKKVTGLFDVTIAGHPAYEQTSIGVREIDKYLDSKTGGKPDELAAKLKELEEKARRERERRALIRRRLEMMNHLFYDL